MTQEPHVLHVGFSPWDLDAIDFVNYRNTVIMDKKKADTIDEGIKAKFAAFLTFDAPEVLDLDAYEKSSAQIQPLADVLVRDQGIPQGIVGMYEHVTLPAARLRERYGVRGTTVCTAILCRDKIKMKRELRQSIRVPRFMEVTPLTRMENLRQFVEGLAGKKVVVKPCSQAGSHGVHIFSHPESALDWLTSGNLNGRLNVEEFVEGDIYHFDGLVRDGDLHIFSGSQCLGSCFDLLNHGTAFGAVTIDDERLFSKAKAWTETILRALQLTDSVFHLEAIRCSKDGEFVFLEIANRFGGAGIPKILNKVYSIDLPKEAFLADIGDSPSCRRPTTILDRRETGASAYLWMPLQRRERARVRAIHGLDRLPASVFYSETPYVGQWFNEKDVFFPNSGRFFMKGSSTFQLIKDSQSIMRDYKIHLATPDEWPV